MMKLVVGIGNPGSNYQLTKHNMGFMVVERLAEKLSLDWEPDKYSNSQIAKNDQAVIAKPMTYVNRSGEAVEKLKECFELNNDEIMVVHDDADLSISVIKIKKDGSSAGHKGIESIDKQIGRDYWRIRVGIGRGGAFLTDYVLSAFNSKEREQIRRVIDQTAALLLKYLEGEKLEATTLNAQEEKQRSN